MYGRLKLQPWEKPLKDAFGSSCFYNSVNVQPPREAGSKRLILGPKKTYFSCMSFCLPRITEKEIQVEYKENSACAMCFSSKRVVAGNQVQ